MAGPGILSEFIITSLHLPAVCALYPTPAITFTTFRRSVKASELGCRSRSMAGEDGGENECRMTKLKHKKTKATLSGGFFLGRGKVSIL